jgi:hypothetical protein
MTPLEQAAIDAARRMLQWYPLAPGSMDNIGFTALRAALAALDAAPTQRGGADSGIWCAECQAPVCDHVAKRLAPDLYPACDCKGTGLPCAPTAVPAPPQPTERSET